MKNIQKSSIRQAEFTPRRSVGAALLSAAMALPMAGAAHADSAPERGIIGYKHLDFVDSQPDSQRLHIKADQYLIMAPINGEWSLSGTYTSDVISGASPGYHTGNLTWMHDTRDSLAIDGTRYFPHGTMTVGSSVSRESDYLSRGMSVSGTHSNASKNTTWAYGAAITSDQINPNNHIVRNEVKKVLDLMAGVTQVLTINDIVQLTLGVSRGNGYFSDPYKLSDNRPRDRNHTTVLARWNHYIDSTEATVHASYRYYTDSWGIKAHTLEAEYVQPLSNGWTVTPLARLYTQNAADFYLDSEPSPFGPPNQQYYSGDQRLSAFGAHTLGIKISKQLNADWLMDMKYESYGQRASWCLSGNGSPHQPGSLPLAPYNHRAIQVGLSRQF